MPLEDFLLDLLEDPVDHGPLLYLSDANVLYNPRRRVVYEVRDAIPVLLPDESKPVNDEEHESFMKDPTARSTGNKP
jgi:uncharacterized protein YbaR (Trm112 family)